MTKTLAMLGAAALAMFTTSAQAQTCVGNCGTTAPNGDITAPPAYGPNYSYVTTLDGVLGAGQIESVGGTDGSEYITSSFDAVSGDTLNFYFNYVTADGSSDFSDYGFAELLLNGSSVGYLFTARTTISGDTSPGFGLPTNISTLSPAATPIIDGAPVWDQLGPDSGTCFDVGCGYTGWIQSTYELTTDGSYQIRFGVTNFGDDIVESGLAFAGVTINDVPVDPIPEPATWAMMIGGIGAAGGALRRRHAKLALA